MAADLIVAASLWRSRQTRWLLTAAGLVIAAIVVVSLIPLAIGWFKARGDAKRVGI